MARYAGRLALVVLVFAASACTSLPDTSGYTVASYQLKSAAAAAGSALHTELARTAEQLPENSRARATELAVRFDAAWATTVRSLDGTARYAESIEELTKAGNSGGERARAVADSASDLAAAIGIIPGAPLVGVATDTFALLNSAIANIRAARSLERSLVIADPLIGDMTNVMVGQVGTARQLFENALELQRVSLEFSVQDIAELDTELALLEVETARTLAALSTAAGREAERRDAEADLKRILDGRAALAPRMSAYWAGRETLAARQRAGRDLFDATDRALAAWRESHQKTVRAIRDRQPVSFQSLAAAGEDIKDLIERWRDL